MVATRAKGEKATPQDEILRRVISIDNRQISMEDSLAWLVHAEDGLRDKMLKKFGTSRRRVQVYLALDGVKNVNAVASALSMKIPNVSRDLRWLKKERLIDLADANGPGIVYKKKFFDAIVGLSEELMKKFTLNERGLPK
jgi:DNA-binding transcriptional ArsR family regulator